MSSSSGWAETQATIFKAEYITPSGRGGTPFWSITYSYRVAEEYYSGDFVDFANDSDVEYHKDDVLTIEYLEDNPAKSRFSDKFEDQQTSNTPSLIGVFVGITVIVLFIVVGYLIKAAR